MAVVGLSPKAQARARRMMDVTSALKVVTIVLLGIWAAKWLNEEEYGEKRFQRIINGYVGSKAISMGR